MFFKCELCIFFVDIASEFDPQNPVYEFPVIDYAYVFDAYAFVGEYRGQMSYGTGLIINCNKDIKLTRKRSGLFGRYGISVFSGFVKSSVYVFFVPKVYRVSVGAKYLFKFIQKVYDAF